MTHLPSLLRRFAQDESGAVTVDWVALTAGLVVAGLAISYVVLEGAQTAAGTIADALTNMSLPFADSVPGGGDPTDG
jgi:Flp pilus assembly pilin Flp